MKVEFKKVEDLVHEVTIEVTPELVNEKLEAKYLEIKKKAKFDGYRPGKVPMKQIKAKFEDEVKADTADDIIKATFPDALKDKDFRVASTPAITDLEYTDNGGMVYKARIEVFPEVKDLNLDGLIVTKTVIDVSDEELDSTVTHVRKTFAEKRDVDRPAKEGDLVLVDLVKTKDEKMILPDSEFPDSVIDLGNPITIKEFREQIPGVKAGEEKEIEVSYDKDYPDKKFAGAKITYLVKTKKVQEQLLPEFDDAFAKTTGQAETALELRMKIREDIERQKKNEFRRMNTSELVSQVCDKNQVPIPNGLVNEYLSAMVDDAKKQNPELEEADLRNSYQGVAVNTLRWHLLYNHLAEKEKIEVLPADTEKVIKSFADNYRIPVEQARDMLQKTGKIKSIQDTLIEEKVIDFLMGKAEVVEKKEEPQA